MQPLDSLALVLAAGIGCQWLASRLHIPALILLLACGLVLGPVTHLLVPTQQFGLILMPAIKLGVAIILFEGGLNLHFHELKGRPRRSDAWLPLASQSPGYLLAPPPTILADWAGKLPACLVPSPW